MKMAKFKSATAVMVAAVALAMAGASQAATYDLGTVTSSNVTLDTIDLPLSGSFSDTFTFTLGQGSAGQVGVTSFFYGSSPVDVPMLSLSLDGGAPIAAPVAVDFDYGNVAYGYTFTGLQLNHKYTLVLTGSDSSSLGTSYSFQIAAVPEPETYGMLMAGLGLMGMIARRRKHGQGA
jgi:hypothetical protein